jgi:hypothetical protein
VDVIVGVAVTGRVARLAMVGSGGQVFDQYALDLPDDATTDLADTIVGTYRAVADSGNRVAATRLCLPDASQAATLRQTVLSAGVQNVEVVAEAEAATALARSVGADAVLLLADDDTVSLTAFGEDDESMSVLASVPIGAAGAAAACAAVLQQVPGPEITRIMLVGQRLDLDSIAAELHSTAPVEVPPDAGYAIARGAAQTAEDSGFPAGAATMMAPAAADATMMAPAASDATQMAPVAGEATQMAPVAGEATQMAPATAGDAVVGPQLAYSEEEPGEYELPFDSLEEFVPELEDEEAYTAMIAPPPPRTVLMGSALAFVVAAFATLAVSVAITIRPAASVEAQPVPPVQSDTVPGRYLPPVPHEPDPVALPIAVVSPAPAAPAPAPRTNRGPNSFAPEAPAPEAPPPGPAPVPEVPGVPIPPIVPFPPFNPFPTLPTFTTTVTTSVTPTTTTTTTTTTPTTTTTTPTTTTTTPTTTTTTTTSTEPSIPPVIEKTAPPVTQAPAYSPAPAYTPPPEPAYTPPAAPAYTPPAVAPVAPAPAPVAPAPAPVIEKPAPAPVVEAPVTTLPVSP